MENNRDYEDLFLMAACDEHIVANSTFSWWGAWIGGGQSILPRDWGPAFGSTRDPASRCASAIVLDVPQSPRSVA